VCAGSARKEEGGKLKGGVVQTFEIQTNATATTRI
jgi:hypothetical protein